MDKCAGPPFAIDPPVLLSVSAFFHGGVVGPLRRGVTSTVSDSNDVRFAFTVDVVRAGRVSGAGVGDCFVFPPRKDFAMDVTLPPWSGLGCRCTSEPLGRSLADSGETGWPLLARFFSTMALFHGGNDFK